MFVIRERLYAHPVEFDFYSRTAHPDNIKFFINPTECTARLF